MAKIIFYVNKPFLFSIKYKLGNIAKTIYPQLPKNANMCYERIYFIATIKKWSKHSQLWSEC